jgi:CBS domain-containing protein
MKVSDIMTSEGLATATLDTTLAEIATRMRDENVGAIPIVDEDEKLAGIITDRDIVVRGIAEGEDPDECTAEDILSEQLHTIHPQADLEEAAELMARHQIRRLPVVEDEVIVGMISLGDLAVKAEEDEASAALEDISEGVREAGSTRDETGRNVSRGARVVDSETRGTSSRTGGVESTFAVSDQSPGEQVAEEETEYQRESAGRQEGGSRSSSSLASRLRNWSRSQQTVAHEAQQLEGEEASDIILPTVVEGRGRSSQQRSPNNAAVSGRERSSGTGLGARASEGKPGSRASNLRSSDKTSTRSQAKTQAKTQGASNRSRDEEDKRQSKVTPMRSTGRSHARTKSKRKAS